MVELSTFRSRSFAIGCALSFFLGIGLFGSVYLMPVFLAYVRHHDAFEIGTIMLVTGVAQLVTAPIAGLLESRLDPRWLSAAGFGLFAVGLGCSAFESRAADFQEMFWPQVLRGVAIMFCLLPPTRLALGSLNPSQIPDASGLFNLMRNLGGAIGIALIDTILYGRTIEHADALRDRLIAGDVTAAQAIGLDLTLFTHRPPGVSDATIEAYLRPMVEQAAFALSANEAWALSLAWRCSDYCSFRSRMVDRKALTRPQTTLNIEATLRWRPPPSIRRPGATCRLGRGRLRDELPRRRRDHHKPACDHRNVENRGVDMHRHPLDESLGEKRAGDRDRPDQQRKASTCAVTAPARPNTEILIRPVPSEIIASVAITAAPSRPAAIKSESRITPEPDVPPTSTPCTDGAGRKAGVADLDLAAAEHAAQRHAQDQHGADHQRCAGIGEARIAVGAERRRQCRAGEHDQRAAAIGIAEIGSRTTRIGEDGGDRDDRHHRLGADQRHQHQRHQRAGAVAGKTTDDRSKQRHQRDQQKLQKRDIGEA